MEKPLREAKQLVIDHWELINSLARKRFGESSLAEEAALFVMNGLVEDNGRRVRSYAGKAPFPAFLAAVAWRLLEDFPRSRYGRRRPPKWIHSLGGIWLRLFKLLCYERLDLTEAVHIARQEQTGGFGEDPEEVAWKIKERVTDCGSHQGYEVSFENREEEPVVQDRAGHSSTAATEEKEKRELFTMIFMALTDVGEHVVEENHRILSGLNLTLEPEEKLLLRLCYREGVNVARAGEMLGLNRHQAHGRLRRLLARIRNELEQSGLGWELVELLR